MDSVQTALKPFGRIINTWVHRTRTGSPVLPVAGSLATGLLLAVALLLGPAFGGTESVVTGSGLLAFAIGWGLMAPLTTSFSSQPQRWTVVPAAFLGTIGLGLVALQPGNGVMNVLGWFWPPAILLVAVWSFGAMRRALTGRTRWLLNPVLAVLVLFAVGGGVQTIAQGADQAAHPAPGRLISIDGHRMHIVCAGTDAPTVVLESGAGESSIYWSRIFEAVAPSARVCAYDRPGRGWSDPVGPQDGTAIAHDLHALLAAAGETGPYVLVGHSTGGLYVRIFAATYPAETAGMVLLDSQPATAFTALPDYPRTFPVLRMTTSIGTSLARIGVSRLAYLSLFATLPDDTQAAERADQSSSALAASARDEFAELPATIDEALATPNLGSKPLAVVTALSEAQRGWLDAQNALAGLSSNSSHVVLEDLSHLDVIETARGSMASSDAILAVVASARSGKPME